MALALPQTETARTWLTGAAEVYLTDFIPPHFFALGDQKAHVLAQNQTGINAINHSPVNGPRCGNGLLTSIGLNCGAYTQQPVFLHTSHERNRGKWSKIGAKRGETRPKSACRVRRRLLRCRLREHFVVGPECALRIPDSRSARDLQE